MTLEIGFSREGNALKVNRAEPVFPYPPYAKDGICLYTAPSEIPGCSPFCGRLNAIHDIRENAKESRHLSKGLVLVQYGDRELAVFASSTNLVTGMCGTYPDYGASVKITVYGDAGSNPFRPCLSRKSDWQTTSAATTSIWVKRCFSSSGGTPCCRP